ncbi:hypothetical protein AGMMS50230_03050 [Spirochaetia bacterium]|nr:hypothetical protein AGMMS50230_03050 [Spirochaetia bacterium]
MKLLLHVCCAPCSTAVLAVLRNEGIKPTLFWYNPNIHPFTEYRSRRDTLVQYAKTLDLPLIMEDLYGLREFTAALAQEAGGFLTSAAKEQRCSFCYRLRMEKTAAAARQGGFDCFSTTLFVSPYQDHEKLRKTAETAENCGGPSGQGAAGQGAALYYQDFRPFFREGQEEARRLGLYRQKYCGCIFSEEERYVTNSG